MKAHISAEPRCALLWNFGPQQTGYAHLARTAAAFGLKLRAVGTADLGRIVGDLCAGKTRQAAPAAQAPTARAALIVSGLRHDDGTLGRFVDEVRRGGADIPLRAMVTPTSRTWTLGALLAELDREHDETAGGRP